jgi:hypothetical protein
VKGDIGLNLEKLRKSALSLGADDEGYCLVDMDAVFSKLICSVYGRSFFS